MNSKHLRIPLKFEKIGIIDEPTASNVIIVKGSKGNEYRISAGKCSCPGFVYRNDCKHIKELV
jgi:predicted nucleic acid-binding Zn finger protein